MENVIPNVYLFYECMKCIGQVPNKLNWTELNLSFDNLIIHSIIVIQYKYRRIQSTAGVGHNIDFQVVPLLAIMI